MMGRQGMDFGRDEFMQMIGLPYFCGYLKISLSLVQLSILGQLKDADYLYINLLTSQTEPNWKCFFALNCKNLQLFLRSNLIQYSF